MIGFTMLLIMPTAMFPVISASNHTAKAVVAGATDAIKTFHAVVNAYNAHVQATAVALRTAFDAAREARDRAQAEIWLRCLLAVLCRFGLPLPADELSASVTASFTVAPAQVHPVDAATMKAATAAKIAASPAVAIAATAAKTATADAATPIDASALASVSFSSSTSVSVSASAVATKSESATRPAVMTGVADAAATTGVAAEPTLTPTSSRVRTPLAVRARKTADALARSRALRASCEAKAKAFEEARAAMLLKRERTRERARERTLDQHVLADDVVKYTVAHDDAIMIAMAEKLSSRHAALGPVPSDTVLQMLACLFAKNDGQAFELDDPLAIVDIVLRVLKGHRYDVQAAYKEMARTWSHCYRVARLRRAKHERDGDVEGVARADAMLHKLTYEMY